jgi:general secretion pathway protein G
MWPISNHMQKTRGFSYVEMVFSVAMLALLAAIATPYLEKNIQRKKETELRQNLRQIRMAIDSYKAAADAGKIKKAVGDSGYPPSLESLVDGVEDVSSPNKQKLYFIRRIPADPMFAINQQSPERAISPADTWGKSSYASDADYPREGADVYDVYSLSTDIANNGVAYRDW